MTQQPCDLEKRVRQYVALRDKIGEIKERHKAELEPYNKALEALNNVLLGHLLSTKAKNAATVHGTVFVQERVSATIADGEVFRNYVVNNQFWDLVDWKANKTEVKARVDEHAAALAAGKPPPNHGGLPPGLNFTRANVAGVQRS